MKNLSKVLAVVLVLALCLTTVSFAAFTDVAEGADYENAVTVLSSLGILKGYEDGSFKPDGQITRAEFATVVCRLLGLGGSAGGTANFTDVAADHWATGYIALASQQGIVNGYGDGKFGPEDPVKYEEAIKMVVAAMGYTPMADVNGGYPGGYQLVAAQKGLLSGITNAKAGEAASRSVVAQISFNALDVPLMIQSGYGTNTAYETGDELLLNKIGVVKFEGTVNNTSETKDSVKVGKVQVRYDRQYTAISEQSSVARVNMKNEDANPYLGLSTASDGSATVTINLDDAIASQAANMLDYAAYLYVKDADDDDDAKLVAITSRGAKNKELVFASEDVYDSKTVFVTENRTIKDENNQDKNVKVNIDVTKLYVYTDKDNDKYSNYDIDITKVYLNGRQNNASGVELSDSKDIKELFASYCDSDKTADIKLLSNNSDETYNVAYVTEYTDYVVDSIAAKTYKISSKDNQTIILDEEDDDLRFTLTKDGAAAKFSDIQINDVLSVAGYKNSSKKLEYGNVIITSKQVSGAVSTYSTDDKTLTVDGTVYDYDSNKINFGSGSGDKVNLGDTCTFYINARGVICGVDKTATNTNLKYGFATVAAKSAGVANNYQIRILTSDDTWTTFDFATKAKVFAEATTELNNNVSSVDVSATVLAKLGTKASTNDNYIINAVVGYEVNSSNEINKIYKTATTDDFEITAQGNKTYYDDTEALGGAYLNDNTILFSYDGATLPAQDAEINEDKVQVAKKAALINRQEYKNITAYNLDDDNYAAAIIGTQLVGDIDLSADFFMVGGVSTQQNADGDNGRMLSGAMGGEDATIFVPEDATIKKVNYQTSYETVNSTSLITNGSAFGYTDFAKGDVIIFSKDANGEADKVLVLADASDIVDTTTAGVDGFKSATGNILKGGDVVKTLTFRAGDNDYNFYFGYVIDSSSSRFTIQPYKATSKSAAVQDLTLKSDATLACFNQNTTSSGKVTVGDKGDINVADKELADGDYIFVRTLNDTSVEDVAIFNNKD